MAATAYGSTHSRSFVDVDRYQAAIRGGDSLYSILGRGVFRADLTNIKTGPVRLQRGRETLPRLAASAVPANEVGILAWPSTGRLPVVRGAQIRPGELLCLAPGMQSHHRTSGSNEFWGITLDASELARLARDLTGREFFVATGKVLRPPEYLVSWLHSIIQLTISISETTPQVFSSPQAAKGLEQALLRPMIACLQYDDTHQESLPHSRRAALAKKFEEAVEANLDRPLHLRELCRVTGLCERSLRHLCQEQMGVSPLRFLALRRLNLARQALLRADPHSATVTDIALDVGIWEFGRFAVAYKSLFGESPSATLRRRSDA